MIEKLTQNLKKVKELAKDVEITGGGEGSSYFTHFLIVILVTVGLIGLML